MTVTVEFENKWSDLKDAAELAEEYLDKEIDLIDMSADSLTWAATDIVLATEDLVEMFFGNSYSTMKKLLKQNNITPKSLIVS